MIMNTNIGATIGAMIRAAGGSAAVRIEDDAIIVVFSDSGANKTAMSRETRQEKVNKGKKDKSDKKVNKGKKVRRSRNDMVTCNGETRSIADWAKKEKVTIWTICYRLNKHGSPLGIKKPTDKDKIIMGS